jgi:hypothetical protein
MKIKIRREKENKKERKKETSRERYDVNQMYRTGGRRLDNSINMKKQF